MESTKTQANSNCLSAFYAKIEPRDKVLVQGRKQIYFCKESINIVKSNIKKARVENESTVLNLDFKSAINSLALKKEKFDVIFMDPPYYKNMFSDALLAVDNNELLKEDGIIVVEHDTVDKFPDNMGRLYKSREKKYGNTTITFYKVEE